MKENSPNATFLDKVKFLLSLYYGSLIDKTSSGQYSLERWLIRELKDNKKMILFESTLGYIGNDSNLVKLIFEALNRGKKITVLCGPLLLKKEFKNNNLLVLEYLKRKERYKFFKIYFSEELSLIDHFGFIINGKNVLLKKPILPSESDKGSKGGFINNSIIWRARLNTISKWLIKNSILLEEKKFLDKFIRSKEQFIEIENKLNLTNE